MKFIRRPDLDQVTRTEIAAQAVLARGVYGEMTRLARCYRVRLVGHCSLESIAFIAQRLGCPSHSVGYLSQRLKAFAQALPQQVVAARQWVVWLSDEIFAGGQSILITVEPRTLAILKIALASDREATTWQRHWEEFVDAGAVERIVADRGTGLVKGGTLAGLTHHPDLFHLLHPLAPFGGRFERQALAAMAHEYERGALDSGRSLRVHERRRAEYEAARAAAAEKVQRYDNCCYLWSELRRLLEAFDETGRLPDLATRQADIGALLELLASLGSAPLQEAVKSLATGLEDYWGYYERLATVYAELCVQHSSASASASASAAVAELACGWQRERQATNSKDYGQRKRLRQAAQAHYDEAA
ncbi:MAG: hypothetical protein HOP19_23900, partial [Acidobacteria bacterium]|nr:hypothetical protein [Acidobacteriota bacterium]